MGARAVTKIVLSFVVAGALVVVASRTWRSPTSVPPANTSTLAPATQPETAIWPFVSSVNRYGDPARAAQAFAVSYLGFVDPVMGAFQPGDSRSGEVPVRSTPVGPLTTVLVRRLTAADSWWVLGAACEDIQVTAPTTSERVSSPVVLQGRSSSYEAVVNVEFRQDGSLTPLKVTSVMGGSQGVMRPFSAPVTFPPPSTPRGALLFRTFSAKNGRVVEASVIRISYLR